MKIAYLLLCHKNAESVITQVRALVAAGDVVAIHFDLRGRNREFQRIRDAFAGEPAVAFARRVACGWGEYSLVRATLNLLGAAREAFEGASHYQLISGDYFPSKSRAYIERELAAHDCDFVEINDFFESDWIKTGLKKERLIYRHLFNERTRKRLFYASLNLQRRLGLTRPLPLGLRVKIGSQWWLLRATTVERMFAFMKERPDVMRFFRTTWIPDETAFQTIAFHAAPPGEIRSHPPTTLIFSDYGIPVIFHHVHQAMLRAEPRFFARKITANDPGFRQALLDHYVEGPAPDADEPGGDEVIAQYYAYLAGRGRGGRRNARRFWRRSSVLDDGKESLVVAAKKWHVGRHFADTISGIVRIPALGYVFDEDAALPFDLGHLEVGKEKRGRHRRAFLGLLFDALETSRITLCIDPARDDVLRDFAATDCRMRALLIETPFSDADYEDHARRVGLLGRSAAPEQRAAIVAALRVEFADEAGPLRAAAAGKMIQLQHGQSRAEKAAAIARFLRAGRDETEAATREIEPFLQGGTDDLRL